jgi:cytochrome c biogenesis protein
MKTTEKFQAPEPITHIWYFFTSIRLALVLIFIIIILSIVSIFLVQVPQGISPGSTVYAQWLETAIRPDFGVWTDTLAFFGLFNVFRSWPFLGAGILLISNIFCCIINRWRVVKAAVRGGTIPTNADYYRNASIVHRTTSPVAAAALSVTGVLLRRRYRVGTEEVGHAVFVMADRYAFSRMGTIISHLSLILLVIGFLLGSFLGFRNDFFIVAEGTTQEVGHDTGLALGLVSFTADYWPDGTPREYRSQVTVYRDGEPVDAATIRVNHPLTYAGIRFFQSFYGPAAAMQVNTTNGNEVANTNVALIGIITAEPYQRPLGRLELPGTGLTAYLVAPAMNVYDPILQHDEIGMEIYEDGQTAPVNWVIIKSGETVEIQGLEFTYVKPANFSGFSIKYDPGTWLVWAAFGLFIIGISMVFYLPFRQVRVMVEPEEEGSTIYLQTSGKRGFDNGDEINKVTRELSKAIPGRTDTGERGG